MDYNELRRKYRHVSPEILKDYFPPEKEIYFNEEDKDLAVIAYRLPDPPNYPDIDGFGKPASEQKWRAPRIPDKLRKLQREAQKNNMTLDAVWQRIRDNMDYYEEEVGFIKETWHRFLYGYWFFNNGTPTYIDGMHYFYLSFWNIDIGLPHYRYRDRLFFLFARFCMTTTEAFFKYKIELESGKVQYCSTPSQVDRFLSKNKNIGYEVKDAGYLVDMGKRTVAGFNYTKHRREGATYKGACINYCTIFIKYNATGGIQSMNDNASKDVFIDHIVKPWKKLPFWFKPNWDGSSSPKGSLEFDVKSRKSGTKVEEGATSLSLGSRINYEVANTHGYDRMKLYFHHDDEAGKVTSCSVWERHLVIKECLMQGSNIIGFGIKTSTVGEMNSGGGREFETICRRSMFEHRNMNGQTVSGFLNLFVPAYINLEGFTDEFGNPVVEDPEEPVKNEFGEYISVGAKNFLDNKRDSFIAANDVQGLIDEMRKFPQSFSECFSSTSRNVGWNMIKLGERITEVAKDQPDVIVGNFYRTKGMDSRVEFEPTPEGRFRLSKRLKKSQSNRKMWNAEKQYWEPMNTRLFVAGGDPFNYNVVEGKRKSKGGGAVFYKHDRSVDNSDDPKEWKESNRFVCTYSFRHMDKKLYAEDMLMMCTYFSCKMNPEINIPVLWEYFEERGYRGYLLYHIDKSTYQESKKPGRTTVGDKVKNEIFAWYAAYIEHHIHKEVHLDLLEQLRDINGIHEMTHYDLLTAAGYAGIGADDIYDELEDDKNEEIDLGDFY